MTVKKIKMVIPILILVFLVLACGDSANQDLITEYPLTATEPMTSVSTSSIISTPTITSTIIIKTPTQTSFGNATVNVEFANLRLGPGTTFGVVASSKMNDVFPIYGKDQSSEWLIIQLIDELWISTTIVDIDVDINTIPIYENEMTELATEVTITEMTDPAIEEITTEISENENNQSNNNIFNDQLELLQYSTHSSSIEKLIILGEVKNIGESILKDIDVTITLKDKDGNLLDFDSSFVYTPWELNLWETGVLYPNAIAPFRISFEDPGEWVELIPSIKFKEAREIDFIDHYKDLSIINDFGRSADVLLNNYQITGEIENIGDYSCGDVWLVVTLYDNQGNIIGFGDSRTDFDRLNPGESKPFKIELYARGIVDHYSFYYYAIQK